MLRGMLWAAFVGILVGVVSWRRDCELDEHGNLCLRYLGPRFFVPLSGIVWLVVAVKNLSDPFHQKYPENSVIEFGFATLSLLASVLFVPYRIVLAPDGIERRAWPLNPLRYPLSELESIEERVSGFTIFFRGERRLKVTALLSGKKAFIDEVRRLTAKQV
jgi:hypothetical protein